MNQAPMDIALDLGSMQHAADLPDLFAALARAVVRVITCDACVVSLYDERRDVVYDFAASSVGRIASTRSSRSTGSPNFRRRSG